MRESRRSLLWPLAVLTLLAALLSGCGTEQGGAPDTGLADLVPTDSLVYVEGVLKPDADVREAVLAIASRFPEGEQIGSKLVAKVDRMLAGMTRAGEQPLGYEEDVAPWLGERFSLAVARPRDALGHPEASLALETTDQAAAEETLRAALELTGERFSERERDGASYALFESGGAAVGVIEDQLVAATSEQRFLATVRVAAGAEEVRSLADREAFSYDVGTADGSRAFAFAWLDTPSLLGSGLASAEQAPGFTRLEALARRAGIDLRRPSSFAVGITADVLLFDSSLPLVSPEPLARRLLRPAFDPSADAELLGTLPGDAPAAAACTACLRFALRTPEAELGAGLRAQLDRLGIDAAGSAALRQRLGRLATKLSATAAFISSSGSPGLGGALVVESADRVVIDDLVEASRALLAGQQGAKLGRLPKLGPPVAGFEAELPGLFQPLLVAARGRLAVFALGERSARQAFSPGETIADAGIFSPFSDQLGDEFQPSSVLNVEALERLLGGALIGPRLGVGRSYLEPLARIATGTRVDDERLVSRLILAFDGFNQ